MKKRKFVVAFWAVLFLTVLLFGQTGMAGSGQCYFIQIAGPAGVKAEFDLKPEALKVPTESCITWVNWSRAAEVQIKFQDGVSCQDATVGASGFSLDSSQCYVTNFLPYGSTSSLVFSKKGTYSYTVESQGKGKLSGSITVE